MVAIPPAMAGQVAEAGYPFRLCGEPDESELAPLRELLPTLPPAQATIAGNRDLFAKLAAGAMLPGMAEIVDDWEPGLVVREPCEYASAVIAEARGLPHVQVAISSARGEISSIRAAAPALEEHSPGLTAALIASPYLSRFPASLDPSPFPHTVRYREPGWVPGPVSGGEPGRPATGETGRRPGREAAGGASLPDWWPAGDRAAGSDLPLVYLTFGTVLGHMTIAGSVIETALAAVGGMAVRVLLTYGRRFGVEELGELPPNVHAEPWVDQDTVLPHADLVVCHGGSGTVLGALGAGVPMVVVPSFADQFDNGRRIEEAGAGLTVEARQAGGGSTRSPIGPQDAPRIAAAMSEVLGSASYRQAARRIGDEMAASPLPAVALAALAALAPRR